MNRTRLLSIGLPLLPLLLGCRGKAEPETRPLQLIRIEIQDRTAPKQRVVGLTREKLRGWVVERLRAAPEVRLEEGAAAGPQSYQLSLELGVGERSDEQARRVLLASLRARAVAGSVEGLDLQASAVKPLPAGADELAAVKKVVEGLLGDLIFQAALANGPPTRLVRALGESKDQARLAAAVEIAGARKLRETVPPLIKLLQHKEDQISDRAIGALVAIGDRAAVAPLTRLSRFEDTARMAKVLDAIGTLGGQEARDYLEFVSTGHEDADIRNLAAEALERLKRDEKKK